MGQILTNEEFIKGIDQIIEGAGATPADLVLSDDENNDVLNNSTFSTKITELAEAISSREMTGYLYSLDLSLSTTTTGNVADGDTVIWFSDSNLSTDNYLANTIVQNDAGWICVKKEMFPPKTDNVGYQARITMRNMTGSSSQAAESYPHLFKYDDNSAPIVAPGQVEQEEPEIWV